jgi:tyrosyl-tRNA synthetase
MHTDFIFELQWRGLIHDIMPGTAEQLTKEMTSAYIGFDPTSDSLHIGNLVSIMLLKHFQLSGHKPIVLVGGATGMIGDPSGKSEERNLLDENTLRYNQECIKNQLSRFLEFEGIPNKAEMVNNYDWMKEFSFLEFIRDIGKHITVNYMMAKDSVKKRLETGLSFTEFTYQLVQGYDYLHLYRNKNCRLQMGGSDQWGNIVTGTELIRRKEGGEAFALTSPLITKSDGGKFGKTEQGNVWLDAKKTSPYQFYQFWLNTSDADAETFIRIFTLFSKEQIDKLIEDHKQAPHVRLLQKELARDITIRVHSESDYNKSVEASEILFGKSGHEKLNDIDNDTLLSAFEGVPQFNLDISKLETGINIIDLLSVETSVFASKGEARRMMNEGGLSINKNKAADAEMTVKATNLVKNKFLIVQKGKKNYYLIICS